MAHYSAETSWKSLYHYGQGIVTGNFQLFDYHSKKENRLHYGTPQPPQIDLSKVGAASVPMAMFAAKDDMLASLTDAHWTHNQIIEGDHGKEMVVHYQEIKGGHATFLIGGDMGYLWDMLELVKKYNPVES